MNYGNFVSDKEMEIDFMFTKQLFTKCLAQGAYFISNGTEAAVIDPLRDTDDYLALAKEQNVNIKYIFETHFHADFVSGHLELAKKTGASIVFGPNAKTEFESHIAKDGELFKIGALTIEVLHTPGHTMESSCYLLKNEAGVPCCIFTGDTLFLGDVGRPDLAQKSDVTQDDLAGLLYESLREKIMPLPNEITVYPGHGAGSACGKNMSSDTEDTLGNQKQSNYALNPNMSKAEFVQELTTGLLPPPGYFSENVFLNKKGADGIAGKSAQLKNLDAPGLKAALNQDNAVLLDVRGVEDFCEKHIANSLFIGLDGTFAPWVGSVLKKTNTPMVIMVEASRLDEAVTRLSRVGFDNVLGYVTPSILQDSGLVLDHLDNIDPKDWNGTEGHILDVRKPGEFDGGHVKEALNDPLDYISGDSVKQDEKTFVYCAGGYRSVIASSILKRQGKHNLVNVRGGFGNIKAQNEELITQ